MTVVMDQTGTRGRIATVRETARSLPPDLSVARISAAKRLQACSQNWPI
jgi:hypothetical protein